MKNYIVIVAWSKVKIYLTKTLKGDSMDFLEAQNYLEKVRSQKGIVLGLDTMRHLMAKLNNPQDKVKFIQVAGTNGKGSTAAYLTSILSEAGIKVGRYTSPAVFSSTEQYFCMWKLYK